MLETAAGIDRPKAAILPVFIEHFCEVSAAFLLGGETDERAVKVRAQQVQVFHGLQKLHENAVAAIREFPG